MPSEEKTLFIQEKMGNAIQRERPHLLNLGEKGINFPPTASFERAKEFQSSFVFDHSSLLM
jgi:hypothetical protein